MKNLFVLCLLFIVLSKSLISRAQSGIITTIAGNGASGFGGDGGPATAAQFGPLTDIAIDRTGNIFIIDRTNVIRKINSAGIITRIAGTGPGLGTTGFSGDGGPATAAQLDGPSSVTLDILGNIIFADYGNHVIRKIDTSGIISTIAGTPMSPGFSGDGGPATAAKFNLPQEIRFDAAGNLYITDLSNWRIRKIDTAGIISTFAGNGTWGYSGDGGPATNAQLNGSLGLAFDVHGNVYIGDLQNHVVRKVDASGIISTFAGDGYGAGSSGTIGGYAGDGGPATNARLSPAGLAMDVIGNLYIAEASNNVIRKVDRSGIISTVVGNGYGAGGTSTGGYTGDGGPATACELNFPINVLFDSSQNLYISDAFNHAIRKVSALTTTGIRQVTSTSPVAIAPNPNNGTFTINGFKTNWQFVTLNVSNVLGQNVYKSVAMIKNGILDQEINLPDHLSNGVYFLNVNSGEGSSVTKFLIEK